jgi:hypothetical protein
MRFDPINISRKTNARRPVENRKFAGNIIHYTDHMNKISVSTHEGFVPFQRIEALRYREYIWFKARSD